MWNSIALLLVRQVFLLMQCISMWVWRRLLLECHSGLSRLLAHRCDRWLLYTVVLVILDALLAVNWRGHLYTGHYGVELVLIRAQLAKGHGFCLNDPVLVWQSLSIDRRWSLISVFAAEAADDRCGNSLVLGLECCHHIIIWQSIFIHRYIIRIEVERILFVIFDVFSIRLHYVYVG